MEGSASSRSDEAELAALVVKVEEYLGKTATGNDTDGKEYDSLTALWAGAGILGKKTSKAAEDEEDEAIPAWYSQAATYWEEESNCPPTVDGVLGGFGHVSGTDVAGSRRFLEARVKPLIPSLRFGRAVDCGAGIGRVTKNLLLPMFEKVDLLEQSPRLLAAAPAFIFGREAAAAAAAAVAAAAVKQESGKVGYEKTVELERATRKLATVSQNGTSASAPQQQQQRARDPPSGRVAYLCAGMQDFKPAPGVVYDVVWIQWCIGHLHDLDLIRFLARVKAALRPEGRGVVIVKDNCCDASVDFVVDTDDSSLTRSPAYLKALFRIAGYELRVEEEQEGFPKELFPVLMFCFTAKEEKGEEKQ
jgi:protein N-terminal methyltransferase